MGDERSDAQILEEIRGVVSEYHLALDLREHETIASNKLINGLRDVLGMQWEKGAELMKHLESVSSMDNNAPEI